jgi:hypothetical protein
MIESSTEGVQVAVLVPDRVFWRRNHDDPAKPVIPTPELRAPRQAKNALRYRNTKAGRLNMQ